MDIFVVSTMGDGFIGQVTVNDGLTLGEFIQQQGYPEKADVTVNGEVQPTTYVLKPGDKLTVTPGAVAAGLFNGRTLRAH